MTSNGKGEDKFGFKDHMFTAKFSPAGYYYTRFTKQYADLTLEDLDVLPDLAKELIAKDQKVNEKYLYLEEKKTTYSYMARTEVYYVKNLSPILGKLTFMIQDRGDEHYTVTLVFADHRVMPKSVAFRSGRARAHKPYKVFVKPLPKKVRDRLSQRTWRRGHNRNTSGDIKSDS